MQRNTTKGSPRKCREFCVSLGTKELKMGYVIHLANTCVVCLSSFPWSKIQALTWPCSLLVAEEKTRVAEMGRQGQGETWKAHPGIQRGKQTDCQSLSQHKSPSSPDQKAGVPWEFDSDLIPDALMPSQLSWSYLPQESETYPQENLKMLMRNYI